jgi:hypothetical protein
MSRVAEPAHSILTLRRELAIPAGTETVADYHVARLDGGHIPHRLRRSDVEHGPWQSTCDRIARSPGSRYPSTVPRSRYRQLIVCFALLCQVLAGGLGHMPMAHAEGTAHGAAMAADCPEHAHMAHTDANRDAKGADAHHGRHDSGGSGNCKCPCAHAAALASSLTPTTPTLPHFAAVLAERVLDAPERSFPFFRPPI